jgi:Zn-finger nucleic acid-binding protein
MALMYREPCRDPALPCPACGASLAPTPASLPLSVCAACGGAWLGPDAAVHVMQGLRDPVDAELARASTAATRSAHEAPRDTGTRSCPSCSGRMDRLVFGTIIVDTCVAHGTWFDRGELEGVVAVCAKLRAQQHAGGDPEITAGEVAQGAGFVVASAASVVWDAFLGAAEWFARDTRPGR